MRKRLALCIVAVALSGVAVLSLRHEAPTSKSVAVEPARETTSPVTATSAVAVGAARAASAEIDEGSIPPMASAVDLDRYLGGLESRVKAGNESGDELALALAAAKKADPAIGMEASRTRLAAFVERVHFAKRDRAVGAKMTLVRGLAEKLKAASEPAERARLTREYTAAMADLPPPARAEAAEQLDRLRGS